MAEINKSPNGLDKTKQGADEAVVSVKSLKAQLNELKTAMGNLDEGSDAFKNLATEAGQLQERIRGVNDSIENADPEKKFAPFSRTIQGLAGGFSAAQGAMALFGSESKDLEKTLLKVQGAMAFSQGLNSVLEFKNDFKDLGKIIIEKVVTALTTLKGALIATGLGALVLVVATLVVNWDRFSKAITDTFPSLKVVTDFFKNFKQIAAGTLAATTKSFEVIGDVVAKLFKLDFTGAVKAAKEGGALIAKAFENGKEEENRKIGIENGLKKRKQNLDLLEAQGKDVRQARINLMKDELSILEKGSDEYVAKLIEIEKLKTNIRKETAENQKKIDEQLRNKRIQDSKDEQLRKNKEQDDIAKQIDEERAKQNKADEDELKRKKALADQKIQVNQELYASQRADIKSIAEDETVSYDERVSAYQNMLTAQEISTTQYNDAIKKLDEAQLQSKMALYGAIGQGLGSLSQLAGQETEAGKALAIAQATIDTYAGATKEFGKGGVLGFITGAAVIAAGLANVQKIISVKVPKSRGSGSPAPSIGGTIQPPIFNNKLKQESDNLNSGNNTNSGQSQKQEPLRVYVVANDITNAQDDIKTIIERSTIK